MFNALVTTMTLIALGFVVAWWLRPEYVIGWRRLSINLFDGVGSLASMSGRNLGNEFWFMKYCGAVQLDEGSARGTECPANRETESLS